MSCGRNGRAGSGCPPANQSQDDGDDGDHEQDVDEASQGVAGHPTHQPQDHQDDGNCFEHRNIGLTYSPQPLRPTFLLSLRRSATLVSASVGRKPAEVVPGSSGARMSRAVQGLGLSGCRTGPGSHGRMHESCSGRVARCTVPSGARSPSPGGNLQRANCKGESTPAAPCTRAATRPAGASSCHSVPTRRDGASEQLLRIGGRRGGRLDETSNSAAKNDRGPNETTHEHADDEGELEHH